MKRIRYVMLLIPFLIIVVGFYLYIVDLNKYLVKLGNIYTLLAQQNTISDTQLKDIGMVYDLNKDAYQERKIRDLAIISCGIIFAITGITVWFRGKKQRHTNPMNQD